MKNSILMTVYKDVNIVNEFISLTPVIDKHLSITSEK